MKIEIVGPGCAKCVATENNVKEALSQIGVEADLVHVYGFKEIAEKGVMFTPAVIIDGKTVISGKVPTAGELKEIILQSRKV